MRRIALLVALLGALGANAWALSLAVTELPKAWVAGEAPTAWAKDTVYVLEFWATWCGPCRKAMPHMEALWQELRGEGFQVIGVNIGEQLTPAEVQAFLAKQPTPPTYPTALDPDKKLADKLGVRGIPSAHVILNGNVIWKGHPTQLTAARLRGVKVTGKMPPAGTLPRVPSGADPYTAMFEFEQAADAAAARGEWERAVSLQQQAVLAHPLQKHLQKLFLPAVLPTHSHRVVAEAPRTLAVAELGLEIPVDADALTVVSLWKYPWWENKITQESAPLLPGVREAHTFRAPYRSLTIVKESDRARAAGVLRQMGDVPTELIYQDQPNTTFFKVDDKYKYPFVAVYLGAELLYVGALEAMPSVLAGPMLTAEGYRAAMADEAAAAQRSKALYLKVREGQLEEAMATRLTSGYAALALPYFFAEPHRNRDVQQAATRFAALTDLYAEDTGTLETLLKLLNAWPELADATLPQQERINRTLAAQNPHVAPAYAVGYYVRAAKCAERLGRPEQAQEYFRQAIAATAQMVRLGAFHERLRALPSL